MNTNKIVMISLVISMILIMILLVISMIPVISAQDNIDDLITAHDLNNDNIVILSISDNEGGAVVIEYNIYTGEHEYKPYQAPPEPTPTPQQVPGFTAVSVVAVIGFIYLICREVI